MMSNPKTVALIQVKYMVSHRRRPFGGDVSNENGLKLRTFWETLYFDELMQPFPKEATDYFFNWTIWWEVERKSFLFRIFSPTSHHAKKKYKIKKKDFYESLFSIKQEY